MIILPHLEQVSRLPTLVVVLLAGKRVLQSACIVGFTGWLTLAGPEAVAADNPDLGSPKIQRVHRLKTDEIERDLFNVSQLLLHDPQNPELLFQKGVQLADLGRLQAAMEIFEFLRQQFPDQSAPYANLASVYARTGRLEEARQALIKADMLQANRYQTQLSLASLNLELALLAFNRAIELNPGDEVTQSKLRSLKRFLDESGKTPAPSTADGVNHAQKNDNVPRVASNVTPSKTDAARAQRVLRPALDRLELASDLVLEALSGGAVKSTPAGLPTLPAPKDSRESAVREAMEAWSTAWAQKNFDDYASHYSTSFQPSKGLSRDAWALRKRMLMEKAKFITVKLTIDDVQFSNGVATVRLNQQYRSDRYADQDNKEFKLEWVNGSWKITAERNLR